MFHDLILNGINPDGTIFRPGAGIVRALQEATGVLAVENWAAVAEAGRWIAERYPEQQPKKYGCSSWRQIVQETRFFELRYFEVGERRVARDRKKRPAKPNRTSFEGRRHLTPHTAGLIGELLGN